MCAHWASLWCVLAPPTHRLGRPPPTARAGVGREDVAKGVAEMMAAFGLDEDAHLAACIAALREAAPRLGLAPAG